VPKQFVSARCVQGYLQSLTLPSTWAVVDVVVEVPGHKYSAGGHCGRGCCRNGDGGSHMRNLCLKVNEN
jgi:hypothetical protein